MTRLLLAATIMTSLSLTPTSAEIYKPKTETLPNGLQIVLVENHLAPIVSISLYYKVGTADDPQGMTGLSHFLEHLMFKGTKKVPAGEFKKKISSKGGVINAYTMYDVTAYTCTIAVEHLPMVLEIEADRMQNIVFNEEETKAEQKVVIEERKMRLDNNPLGDSYETFLRAMYRYHPYGIPSIGYPFHINAYTNNAAKAHYETWYKPNNAILVISGDITMDKLSLLVTKFFGSIKSGPIPERKRFQDPPGKGIEQHITAQNHRVSFTSFDWNFKAPNHTSEGKEHYYPLIVLAQILGGNEISRLYNMLVEEKGLAIETSADYTTPTLDPQYFSISATLNPTKKAEDLKQAVNKIIADIIKSGITVDELNAAKRDLLANVAFAKDGNEGAVRAFRSLAYGFTIEDIESFPQKIREITLDQVNAAAKEILGKGAAVTTIVSPETHPNS